MVYVVAGVDDVRDVLLLLLVVAEVEKVSDVLLRVVAGMDNISDVLLLVVAATLLKIGEVDTGNNEKPGLVTVVISLGSVKFNPKILNF